jgi:hypothetical protein
MPDKIRKRQNEAIKKKKKTVFKNIYKLRKLLNIDVIFIIRQNRQYTIYQSVNRADFPLLKEQLISRPLGSINKLS